MGTSTRSVRAFLEPHHVEIAERLKTFCAAEVASFPPPHDDAAARRQSHDILRVLGDGGWCRHAVPDGDARLDLRTCVLIREALAAASPLADAVFALQCLGTLPIADVGGASLRQRWLEAVAEGRAMAGFAMTEPEAGSDVGAIATTARREGDEYVLNGRKWFISNAGEADFYTVFASTGPERGRRGLSVFVVDAALDGVRFVAPQILSAPHPLGELAFDGCRIPVDCRLGAEGDGLRVGLRTLDRLRPTVAAAACGMAARALDEARTHALGRQQFGKRLADFQLIQAKLAQMAIELDAARLLVYRAAWEHDQGTERITLPAAMAKAFATEAAQRIIDGAVQILGGRGCLAEHPVDHLYRSIRALRIYEGTTEIQQLVIARHLLAD